MRPPPSAQHGSSAFSGTPADQLARTAHPDTGSNNCLATSSSPAGMPRWHQRWLRSRRREPRPRPPRSHCLRLIHRARRRRWRRPARLRRDQPAAEAEVAVHRRPEAAAGRRPPARHRSTLQRYSRAGQPSVADNNTRHRQRPTTSRSGRYGLRGASARRPKSDCPGRPVRPSRASERDHGRRDVPAADRRRRADRDRHGAGHWAAARAGPPAAAGSCGWSGCPAAAPQRPRAPEAGRRPSAAWRPGLAPESRATTWPKPRE